MKNRTFYICALTILLVAAAFRFWDLALKPPHFDEGVNGWFIDQMKSQGAFRYDPTNYHGPLHFYILFAAQSLFGRASEVLRFPGALAGVGVVALAIYGYRRHMGRLAALLFGAFLAVSPAMVFVSRYAIHEIWLLLFCMMTALGVMEIWARRVTSGSWWLWMGIAGMILTKETYAIHLLAFILAWPTLLLARAFIAPDAGEPHDRLPRPLAQDLVRASAGPAVLGALLIYFFYSGNLLHPGDVKGLWTTFSAWKETGADGSGHGKHWAYWFDLMWRYEWAAMLGVAACVRFCFKAPGSLRWLVIAGAGAAMAYQIIPYKTPWCVIMVMWTFPLALAWVLAETWERGWLFPAGLVTAVVLGHGIYISWGLNFMRYDDPQEPYVYVQTKRELARFTKPLLGAARRDPTILHSAGAIVVDSSYPLPWILGDFTRIGYYRKDIPVPVANLDFLLVEESRRSEIEEQLRGRWYMMHMPVRDGYEPALAYFKEEMFAEVLPDDRVFEFSGAEEVSQ